GKVGIGDNSPVATLTVGNGDKLQIDGADGDIKFNDDQGSIRFANANGSNASMMYMFASGTNNSTRMLVSHSPNFSSWGLQYNDTADAFNWLGDNIPVMQIQLSGQRRIGIGTDAPTGKVHIEENSSTGFGHLKLTETQVDFSRITMDNTVHGNFWDIAARTDTNLSNAELNIYHSDTGDLLTINARGRVGINDQAPSYALEINGTGSTRTINAYNSLPATAFTTYNYGLRSTLAQAANTGFPRLYPVYGRSTDADSYITYAVYAYADNASLSNYGVFAFAPVSSGYAVYASGDVYATGSYLPSDARLKTGVTSIGNSLELISQLEPKTYQYNQQE
ncbi:MAG: tail fiber domain-containing protein, partial [Bacteroidota bacterium]